MRKTYYMLVACGGGNDGDAMLGARHKTYKQLLNYQRGARQILHHAESNGKDIAAVSSTWKPIYVTCIQQTTSVNDINQPNWVGLAKLAKYFVKHHLKFIDKEKWYLSIIPITKKLLTFSLEGGLVADPLRATYDAIEALEVATIKKAELRRLIRMVTDVRLQDAARLESLELVDPSDPASSKRKKAEDDEGDRNFDIKDRNMMKYKTGLQRLARLREIETEIQDKHFCEALRKFNSETLAPVLKCLRQCFADDEDAFLTHWGSADAKRQFPTTKFHQKCTGQCSQPQE
jgi:hypothetical protein